MFGHDTRLAHSRAAQMLAELRESDNERGLNIHS